MTKVIIHGIKACDTMKKATTWLNDHGIAYDFFDFKKTPVPEAVLENWLTQVPWDQLINKRGTTWRKLDDSDKSDIDNAKAVRIMMANNSIIKRPVIDIDGKIHLGFKPEQYNELFN